MIHYLSGLPADLHDQVLITVYPEIFALCNFDTVT